jgi:single-strand DNA-binding protein
MTVKCLNEVVLLGNLGGSPELKYTTSGRAYCRFSLATNETWTDSKGEKQAKATWHSCVAWEKVAEICNEFLKKGSRVFLRGKLSLQKWEDSSGVKREKTVIVVRDAIFLDNAKETAAAPDSPITDDDIPF